jgi:hypothetical protein
MLVAVDNMKFFNLKKISLSLLIFSPILVGAQGANLNSVIISIAQMIQGAVIPIIIGIALLTFLWGVMKYGLSKDDTSRKESIAIIINGLIILFVMVSLWGLVWLFASFFGVGFSDSTTLPAKQIPSADLIKR